MVHTARRLALEWQAYVVRSSALRRVFVSVKGYYFQAELLGQSVTWLVPHQLSQVRGKGGGGLGAWRGRGPAKRGEGTAGIGVYLMESKRWCGPGQKARKALALCVTAWAWLASSTKCTA